MKVGLLKIREPIWNGRNSNEKIGVSTHHFNTFETLWIQVGWETLNLEQPFPNTYIMTKDFFNDYDSLHRDPNNLDPKKEQRVVSEDNKNDLFN